MKSHLTLQYDKSAEKTCKADKFHEDKIAEIMQTMGTGIVLSQLQPPHKYPAKFGYGLLYSPYLFGKKLSQ